MADVFISHSSLDKAIADRLCAGLEEKGLKCWIAPRDIMPGSEWAAAISNALNTTKVLLLIYSHNSAQSTQVPKELGIADKRGKFIIPYKVDDTELEGVFDYFLTGAHWIMADPANEDYKIEELYGVISGAMQMNPQSVTHNTYIDNLTINNPAPASTINGTGQSVVKGTKANPTKNEGVVTASAPVEKQQKSNKALVGIALGIGIVIVALLVVVIIMLGGNMGREEGKATSGNHAESEEGKVSEATPEPTPSETSGQDEGEEEITSADSFEYTIADGAVTITKYVGNSNTVMIPAEIGGAPVTVIGKEAFAECTDLNAVVLPESIKVIGESAFYMCSSLKQIEIPVGVTTIARWAFEKSGLTSIVIPDSVTQLEAENFIYCKSLTTVTLSDSLEVLEANMFWGCTSLETVVLPEHLKIMETSVFRESGLKNIVIPNSVTYIGECAFYDCTRLNSVVLSAGITEIPHYMFKGCNSLTSITIPENITTIGDGAFAYSGLTEIVQPSSVTFMGREVFAGCADLKCAELSTQLVYLPGGTFYDCSSLTEVSMSTKVEVIGEWAFAFSGINNLSLHLFSIKEVGRGAFSGCTNMENLTLPDTLVKISEGAFQDCSKLTQVTIPDSVKGCASNAFYGNTAMTITYNGAQFALVDDGYISEELYSLINVTEGFEYTLTEDGVTITRYTGTDPVVVIPERIEGKYVTEIGYKAFAERSDIEFVTMFHDVKNIGEGAFHMCTGLKMADLSSGMLGIGEGAFMECNSLEYVELPETLTEINMWAFGETALKYVTVPKGITTIPYAMFYQCEQLRGIYLQQGLVSIEPWAFGKTALSTVTLPYTVTEVANNAFADCTDISLVYGYNRYSIESIANLSIWVDMGQ